MTGWKRLSALFSVAAAAGSLDLKPVASVSVLLFCGDEQLQVRGAVQISLPLKAGLPLRAADTVPAWAFNFNTGKKTAYGPGGRASGASGPSGCFQQVSGQVKVLSAV